MKKEFNKIAVIMKLKSDLKKTNEVLNSLIPITSFLGETTGTIFCPFHSDVKKPSAKLYDDNDYPRLWCYACRKQYTSYDYIKEVLFEDPINYLLTRYDPELISVLFDKVVIDKSREVQQEVYLNDCKNQFNGNIVEYIDNVYKLKDVKYV